MTLLIDQLINPQVMGHETLMLDSNGPHVTAPVLEPGIVAGVVGLAPSAPGIDELVDRQAVGWSGPSLDAYTPPDYRAGRPGFGGFNDQPWQSGPANFSPGVIPSQEVGTGKPPGWVAAHMPVVQGVNPTRSSYAYQGIMADGQQYTFGGGDPAVRTHEPSRPASWVLEGMRQPGQQPEQRALSMFPGSAVVEQGDSYSLAELLGRVRGAGWGIQ